MMLVYFCKVFTYDRKCPWHLLEDDNLEDLKRKMIFRTSLERQWQDYLENIMTFLQSTRKVISVYLGKYEVTSIVNQTNDSSLLIPEQKNHVKSADSLFNS